VPTSHKHLKRLPAEHYRGDAYVHWSLTIEDRKTSWLIPTFYYKFREILTHTCFRFGICCPIYCCMPDHIHMLWLGILPQSDQVLAHRYLRKQFSPLLEKLSVSFQPESYDHVLQDDERLESAFETVAEYIARNPERRGLVPTDDYAQYKFTGCLVPGYPELKPFEQDYWERFWRVYSHLKKNGLLHSQVPSKRHSAVADFARNRPAASSGFLRIQLPGIQLTSVNRQFLATLFSSNFFVVFGRALC
jgi:putative transposase